MIYNVNEMKIEETREEYISSSSSFYISPTTEEIYEKLRGLLDTSQCHHHISMQNMYKIKKM